MTDLTELAALDAKATPGPWEAHGREIVHPEGPQAWNTFETANVALMVAARNAVPEILAALAERDALRAEVERLREVGAGAWVPAKQFLALRKAAEKAAVFIGEQEHTQRGEKVYAHLRKALKGTDHD